MKYEKLMPVMADGRFGYWVGYDPTYWVDGLEQTNPTPCQVQFGGNETELYRMAEIRKARFFADYLLNQNGVGKTGFVAFFLVLAWCCWGTWSSLQEPDWTVILWPIIFACFIVATWLNFRGIFK